MLASLRTALSLALLATLAVGCAATEDSEDETTGETDQALGGNGHGGHGGHGGGWGGGHGGGGGHEHSQGHRRRRNKNGQPRPWGKGHHGHEQVQAQASGVAIVADVDAQGTGCPDGSWDASISDDGQTFTIRLNQYEATIKENEERATKDCRISIKLTSPEGLSFSVANFFYSGYVFLESEGMRASYSAKYSFLEDPRSERRADREMLTGPRDEEFTFQSDPVPTWSPCGGTSTLNIDTRMTVVNNRQKTGEAFMNNSAVDGAIGNNDGTLAMKWQLGWRRCGH